MFYDPYAVLGLHSGASTAQVRKAYRRLAKLYHPDANAGDAEKAERFKEVQRAYEILTGEKTEPLPASQRPRQAASDDEHPFLRYMRAYAARKRA